MKKIMINNERDLLSFLEVVAKESVVKSLRESGNSDHNVTRYNHQKKEDSKTFKALREEDEEIPTDIVSQETNKDSTAQTSHEHDNLESEITPRKIIVQINNIRAGHSLKNSDVKENLITFLERLDENEVLVLFYYLEGIAQILNQTIKGSDVIDPSENPLYISMNRDNQNKKSEKTRSPETKKALKTDNENSEDTSPPIRVNENQHKEDIRRKIRILMS
jgi:hypothetical protein